LRQILERGYAEPFSGDSRKVFLIGASFSTVTCTIDDFIIERLGGSA